jgi:hypothetical protein
MLGDLIDLPAARTAYAELDTQHLPTRRKRGSWTTTARLGGRHEPRSPG